MPNRKPTAAGNTDQKASPPWEGLGEAPISIAGMSNDHTEAATITPEAKPCNDFCKRGDISSFIRKTNAAPSIVPNRGMISPMNKAILEGYGLYQFHHLEEVGLGILQIVHHTILTTFTESGFQHGHLVDERLAHLRTVVLYKLALDA